MESLLFIVFFSLGLAYLIVMSMLAFKQRSKVVILVMLNVGIFIYSYFFAPELIARYALSGAKVQSGQAFTLISYMFFHASPMHLLVNTFALLFFGYNMEKYLGWPQLVMIYFVSGLLSGGFYILLTPPNVLVVGASGAIFGLLAYFTLVRPFMISPMPFIIPMPVSVAAVLYVVLIIPTLAAGDVSPVAHISHLGGMVGGVLMAFGMNYAQALKGLIIVIFIAVLTYILPLFFH